MTAKLSLYDLIKAAEYIETQADDTPSSGTNSSVSSPNSSISSAISPNSSSSNSTNVSHLYCNEDVHFENGSTTNNNTRYIKLSSNNEKSGGSFILNEEPYFNGRSQTTPYKPNSPRSSLHHNQIQNQTNHHPPQQLPPHQYNNEQVPTNQNQSKPANNNSTSSLTTTSSPATTTSTTILPSNSTTMSSVVPPPPTTSCVSLSPIIDNLTSLRNANHDSQRIRSFSASGHNIFNSKKRTTPLTPPPISSKREHIESTRTRSISLTANSQQQFILAGYNGILDNNHHHSHQLHNQQQHQSTGNVVYNGNGGSSLISSLQNGNYQIAGNGSRRRTTSTNSTGTRDQHNQSEKSRRAHLKTCFVNLKQQLELKDDEKKKTSNLAILQEAFKQVEDLKKFSQELEQKKEDLAKTKIAHTTRISNLNRELITSGNSSIPERAVSESDAIAINGRSTGASLIGYRYRTSSSGSVISSSSLSTTSSLSPNSLIAHSGGSPISASSSPPLNGLKLNTAPITANSNIPNGIKIPNNFNESKIHSLAAVAVEQPPMNLNASHLLLQNSSTPTSTSIVAAMTNQSLPKDLSNGNKNGLTNQRKTSGQTLTVDSAKIVKVVNSKIATSVGNGGTAATLQQQGYVVSPIYNNKNFKVVELSPGHITPTSTTSVSAPNSAQLHKLLVTGGPQSQRNGLSALSLSQNQSGNEIGRLPGGAELNYVSTNASNATVYRNGNKFTFLNNKDVANRGVHIISPNVATSIVVSQGQPIATNLTPIFSQPTQLAGKTNLTVATAGLPLAQYISGPVKPMVVVSSNNLNPTLSASSSASLVPPTQTTTLATGTTTNVNTS